jgi:hypothetical protein
VWYTPANCDILMYDMLEHLRLAYSYPHPGNAIVANARASLRLYNDVALL